MSSTLWVSMGMLVVVLTGWASGTQEHWDPRGLPDSGKRPYTYVAEYKRLPVYNFGLGKRDPGNKLYSFGLGKRAADYDEDYAQDADVGIVLDDDQDGLWTAEKRARTYGFGLGKRPDRKLYSFGLGKRFENQAGEDVWSAGSPVGGTPETGDSANGGIDAAIVAKREVHSDELHHETGAKTGASHDSASVTPKHNMAKRSMQYGFGLGKRPMSDLQIAPVVLPGVIAGETDLERVARAMQYGFGIGRRSPMQYSFGLGKRGPKQYGFGLGKRENNRQYSFGLGRRSMQYNFGIGKRSRTEDEAEESV